MANIKDLNLLMIERKTFDYLFFDYINTTKLGIQLFNIHEYRKRVKFIEEVTGKKWNEVKRWKQK